MNTLTFEDITLPGVTVATQTKRRRLNAGMARGARQMLRYAETVLGWDGRQPFPGLHVPTAVGGRSREEFKLQLWGLAKQVEGRDDDGHGGLLALTPDGVEFTRGFLRLVPEFAVMEVRALSLDGEVFRTSERFSHLEGRLVGIWDVLPFDQREL